MKKINKLIYICLFAALVLFIGNSCTENSIEYENVYSELFDIKLEGQIGAPVIDYENKTISIRVYSENYAAIELRDIAISKNATTSIPVGGTIDFSTSDSQDISITAEIGGSIKTYTITIAKFTAPPFVGNWEMGSGEERFRFHVNYCEGDDCSERIFDPVSNRYWFYYGVWYWSCETWGPPYCYYTFTNGAATMDNTLSIGELKGVTKDLKMYGDFTFGPGDDGEMGSYEHTHATTGEVFDFNDNYRVMPTNGTWELDLISNKLEFFNADKSRSVLTYAGGDLTDWEFSDDPGAEEFIFRLQVNRNGLMSAEEAWTVYGEEDDTLAKIMGGFALEFRMVKPN